MASSHQLVTDLVAASSAIETAAGEHGSPPLQPPSIRTAVATRRTGDPDGPLVVGAGELGIARRSRGWTRGSRRARRFRRSHLGTAGQHRHGPLIRPSLLRDERGSV